MSTALLTHPACLNHETPTGHPEQAARLKAIEAALGHPDFAPLHRVEAPCCQDAHILLAHSASYLAEIRDHAPVTGHHALDADTHLSPGTLNAAFRAVGATVKAVVMVMSGQVKNAFCATRPPGHHAEKNKAMGFCLFGNIAIAAKHAAQEYGLSRIAIVDFDVHHGNGTQDLIWDDERILYISTHEMPLYPGSGAASETGAHGNIINIPLDPKTGSHIYRSYIHDIALPALRAFKPEIVLISAGFDAHWEDPLASVRLVEDDYIWVTQQICDVAGETARGRLVSTLEGGYDLAALASSTAAHVKVLMEYGE